MLEPIDAVITWVDGNDKAHKAKLMRHLSQQLNQSPEAAAPTRFNQCGEIIYCLTSLLHFAPWLRTIFIVTDNQIPPIVEQFRGTPYEGKIKVIDHSEIFQGFEYYLPTFNSLSIESLLWRIKGLSENFIYLNDDCCLIRPVFPHHFFKHDKIVVRGHWKIQSEKKWRNIWKKYTSFLFKTLDMHRIVQENSAKLAGIKKYFFHLPHAPYPIKKTTIVDYFTDNPDLLANNVSYPLRNSQQFWLISLAHHLEIKNATVSRDLELEALSLNAACHSIKKIKNRLTQADNRKNIAFLCLQSLDAASLSTRKLIFDWLDKKIDCSWLTSS